MIVYKMRLLRDNAIKHQTFGYYDNTLLPTDGGLIRPVFGLRMETLDNAPIRCELIKLVEQYNVNNQVCYIERLCYVKDYELYPYSLKYITPHGAYDAQLIIPKNISMIHEQIYLYPHDIRTPIDLLNSYIRPGAPDIHRLSRQIGCRNVYERHSDNSVINNLCDDSPAWVDVLQESARSFSYAWSVRTRDMKEDWWIESLVEQALMPNIAFADSLTVRTIGETLHMRNLYHLSSGRSAINMSQPPALEIKDPSKTLFSPSTHRYIAYELKLIRYSDIAIKYILSNKTVVKRDVQFAFDRYMQGLQLEQQIAIVDRIVRQCVIAVSDYTKIEEEYSLLADDVVVYFVKTFNEEALFEIWTRDERNLIRAIHIDQAMLSLCSMGAAYFFFD